MPKSPTKIDLSRVKTYPLLSRKSKVSTEVLAKPVTEGLTFASFVSSLPRVLAAQDIVDVADRIIEARKKDKHVILGLGAHVVKVGLSCVVIDLLERGIVTAVAMNGATAIHDLELAFSGRTSEDVAFALDDGSFGMADETGRIINDALKAGMAKNLGFGEAVGRKILALDPEGGSLSILSNAFRLGIPATVHVAIGTDIVHMHPTADGAAIGSASHKDFLTFASLVSGMEGGVYINIGSAVILPEVFLKALSLARNTGARVNNFTTVNMDFIPHYRPLTNVVRRPVMKGGKGINLIGHHEIMVPLLSAMIIERSRGIFRKSRRSLKRKFKS